MRGVVVDDQPSACEVRRSMTSDGREHADRMACAPVCTCGRVDGTTAAISICRDAEIAAPGHTGTDTQQNAAVDLVSVPHAVRLSNESVV